MDKKYFSKRSDIVSLFVVALHIVAAVAPVYVAAAAPWGIVTFLCWLLFGVSMNGILNLMHECCHYHVFRAKKGSEWLGRYVIAPLLVVDFEGYRRRHWDHHRFLGVEGETKDAYLIEIRGLHLLALFLRCLVGLEVIKKFSHQMAVKGSEHTVKDRGWLVLAAAFQLVFFLSLLRTACLWQDRDWASAFLHAVLVYGCVYVYGLASLTVFMSSLRAIAEHQMCDDSPARSGYAGLRNFACNPVSRYLMGAYGFAEHYTHHKIPGIPYYNLPEATSALLNDDEAFKPSIGYFEHLFRIISQPSGPRADSPFRFGGKDRVRQVEQGSDQHQG